jgi:hypothetical protein
MIRVRPIPVPGQPGELPARGRTLLSLLGLLVLGAALAQAAEPNPAPLEPAALAGFQFPDPPREGAGDYFRIAEQGRARCQILVPAGASGALQATARLLAGYLKLATGADFPVVTEGPRADPDRPTIHLGPTRRALQVELGLPELRYGEDRFPNRSGYLIKTLDRRTLLIRGATDPATAHGVVGFLKRYVGVRSYWPGAPGGPGDVIPARPTLSVPDVEWRDWPYWFSATFSTPAFTNSPGPILDFYRRHRVLDCNENYHQWLPPERYAAAHPEYFPLIGGVRRAPADPRKSWQPCVANPDVPRLMGEAVAAYFREHPDAVGVNVAINDGGGDCTCAGCRALDEPADPATGRTGESGRYVRLSNQIAERVAAEFPDKWLVYLAYGAAREAPRTLRPHPRLLPVLTTMGNAFQAWDEWAATGARHLGLYVHHDDAFFILPKFDLHQMVRRLRYAVNSGRARLFYMEWHGQWPFGDVIPCLTAELLWDPRQDPEALLADYYTAFYGAAAGPMREFHAALEAGYERWLATAGRPHPFGRDVSSLRDYGSIEQFRVLSPEEAARARAALERAIAAVPAESREAARLRLVQAQFRLQEMAVQQAWAAFRLADASPESASAAGPVAADVDTAFALAAQMRTYITGTLEQPPWDAYKLFRYGRRPAELYDELRSGQPSPEVFGAMHLGLQAAARAVRTARGAEAAAAWWREQAQTASTPDARALFEAAARAAVGPEPVNLLPDPGFESVELPAGAEELTLGDAQAGRLGIHHWFPERSPGYRYSVTSTAHSGRRALSIERSRRSRFSRALGRVEPGARYRAGLAFRHNAGAAEYRFAVTFRVGNDRFVEPVAFRVPRRPDRWQELVVELEAPPEARVISVQLFVNNQAADARCWIDDAFIGRVAN